MNTQEAFTIAVEGLVEQGLHRSMLSLAAYHHDVDAYGDECNCAYRSNMTDEVMKCAVGHLIPDTLYNRTMELKSIHRLCRIEPEFRNLIRDVNLAFLDELQKAHDSGDTPVKMYHLISDVARRWELDLPESFKQLTFGGNNVKPI